MPRFSEIEIWTYADRSTFGAEHHDGYFRDGEENVYHFKGDPLEGDVVVDRIHDGVPSWISRKVSASPTEIELKRLRSAVRVFHKNGAPRTHRFGG